MIASIPPFTAALTLCIAFSAGCTAFPVRGRRFFRAADECRQRSEPVGSREFEAALDRATGTAARPDTPAKLLQNGDEAYPVMLELIASARGRISMETYIVGRDEITDRFFQALKDAAKRGVEVRLLVDAAGYDRGIVADPREMAAPNLEARVFNPFLASWTVVRANNRDHRKILVVDGHYAVMGGINLSDAQRGDGISGWRDTALLAAGPVAIDAERIFAETWEQAGRGWLGKTLPLTILNPLKKAVDKPLLRLRGKILGRHPFIPPAYAAPENPDPFGRDFYDTHAADIRAVGSSPEARSPKILDLVVTAMLGARDRIDVACAYFVPPREVRRALIAAAERGVRVRLLLPAAADVKFVREIGVRLYGELLAAGVEIYEWPHYILHAKTMAVDGRWLAVGSANLDGRSHFLNYEAVFAARDAVLAEAAHRQFERDVAAARRLTLEEWRRRGFGQRLLETLLTPLAGQF
ncbi:MAG: phosphatidylserine/phosphatidylglycerophosphate/cardiolipin synthase family protein [Planctomycetota bacterium]|jgi:cardiolipin synthase|nr:phosphatidylserine/phosphatidylglycerophosphate/cardiolipin synthase family protein [Planctomycetota bacterium]